MTKPRQQHLALPQSMSSALCNTPNILVIGQGDIGVGVSNHLTKLGFKVTGLARKEREQYSLLNTVEFIQADALNITADQLAGFTHIAIIVTPDNYNAANYQHTYLGIAGHIAQLAEQLQALQRIVFISSTGVYGQNNGEWIDVSVAVQYPKRESAQYILQAEQVLQQAFNERAVIIRPSGIYGVNRLMRIRNAKQQDKAPMPALSWTNRIMDSDLVNVIVKVLTLAETEPVVPIYLATDFMPVTSYELTKWLSEQLDSTLPSIADNQHNPPSGKRLHSNIPRDWLQYPDWQAGYLHILQTLNK